MSKQYSRITNISPRSVLSAYLEKKPLIKESSEIQPIFPFGFNLSQKLGPPGTGKTQTILNIIANAIVNNKTVAVVSNNNSATANVLEKLQKYDVDFIAAYLGNSENKKKFFAEQQNEYPDMGNWILSSSDFQSIKTNLIQSQQMLNEMLEYKNKLATLKIELSGLLTEFQYFNPLRQEVPHPL